MTSLRIAAMAVLLVPAAVCAQPQPSSDAETRPATLEHAAATITEADLARRVGVIAHDSMFGRDTPSPGLEKTAEWIAAELERIGLMGGGEGGGFIQRYPLRSVVVDPAGSRISTGSATLRLGDDFLPVRGTVAEAEASGGVVLVSGSTGAGAALDEAVEGRHAVIVLGSGRSTTDRTTFSIVAAAASAGAASVWVVSDAADARWVAAADEALEPSIRKGWAEERAAGAASPPIVQVRASAVERLLAGRGPELGALRRRAGGAVRADAVPGLEATVALRTRVDEVAAPNVVGVLEGSDPELADEYVVFSAHMDHVGVGAPDEAGDSIFNGADDDASGTVTVIEVAEAMAAMTAPPRRSTIFLLVSGEEHGLWGSEWYADHPTAAVDQLVANLNADMVGRNWPDTIVAIGKEHSDLGATLERVNAAHPELGMTAIDDLWPDERFYFRSDHYNFARNGVPILFFFNGTHEDYHGRDDEADRIDAEKASRIAKLLFYLGVEIANADARPEWNPESRARIVSDGR